MTVTEYPTFTQTKEFRSDVSIETNLTVDDTTRMSVDAAGAAHIMSLLTDLYSDPEGSVIREYISNAYDSHAAAGQSKPIEVSLPGAFDPTFIVKDFGTGMSATEIREIYGSYGRSTKRDKFDQIGAFGLGCKSALTMTQQFTLISIKDGLKNVAIVTRGEDGVGEIKIISADQPTDEPNGVTVKIPVKNYRLFLEKAEQFFFALPKGSILVDGKAPANSLWDGNFFEIPSLKTYISREVGQTYRYSYGTNDDTFHVIMGGVLYPVNLSTLLGEMDASLYRSAFMNSIMSGYVLPTYSIIPVASIDLTPSREDIRYSERTISFLISLIESIASGFMALLIEDIEAAPSRVEAVNRIRHYERVTGDTLYGNATWQGQEIPEYLNTGYTRVFYDRLSNKTSLEEMHRISVADIAAEAVRRGEDFRIPYVEGPVDLDEDEWEKFVAQVRRDFRGWINLAREEDDLSSVSLFIFEGEAPKSPWFTEMGVYEKVDVDVLAEDAVEWRRQRRAAGAKNRSSNGRSGSPQPITYPAISLKDSDSSIVVQNVSAKDLADGDIYVSEKDFSATDYVFTYHQFSDFEGVLKFLNLYGKRIVFVSSSRKVDALLSRAKDVNLRSLRSVLNEGFQNFMDNEENLDDLYFSISLNNSYYIRNQAERLRKFTPYLDQIGDADLKEIVEKISSTEALVAGFETLARMLGQWYTITSKADRKVNGLVEKIGSTLERYPLLDFTRSMVYDNIDHAVMYMTAVNSQRKDA